MVCTRRCWMKLQIYRKRPQLGGKLASLSAHPALERLPDAGKRPAGRARVGAGRRTTHKTAQSEEARTSRRDGLVAEAGAGAGGRGKRVLEGDWRAQDGGREPRGAAGR